MANVARYLNAKINRLVWNQFILAIFYISDKSGTNERIVQEGTSGSDTFFIGQNNGEYEPIVNGLHGDGWGTNPKTIGGADRFILNNLRSKTVSIANFDPSKDKIFLPKSVRRDQVWIEYYLPYVRDKNRRSEVWISYRPSLRATRESARLLGKYNSDFEIEDVIFRPGFKGCNEEDMPPATDLHDHYTTYLEANPKELVCIQGYAPSIKARKLQDSNPVKMEAIRKELIENGLYAEALSELKNTKGNRLAIIEVNGHNPEALLSALYLQDGGSLAKVDKLSGIKNTVINKPKKFKGKYIDKITNFHPSTDTLGIDADSFGIDGLATFAAGKNKRKIRELAGKDLDFLYDRKKGGLYYNENGIGKGFGDGGIIAILKGAPDLSTKNIDFI